MSNVVPSTYLGRPNVFWMIQICLDLRGCFDNFTLKNYPNKFGPFKIRLDGQNGAQHHVARAHPAPKNFPHSRVPKTHACILVLTYTNPNPILFQTHQTITEEK
ncbi:hypothetical protein RHMOL_Rhmol02G0039200 [Rhododendron molle]|uniref:Uncharacterized protein n=1 Tax=Rhododendron molle TaxID=49168 RepID=A0ACC0PMP4_RHOML|nr:hypothetical protein RHMOL_Rhmol02G0039200 [Rhododendron molle]